MNLCKAIDSDLYYLLSLKTWFNHQEMEIGLLSFASDLSRGLGVILPDEVLPLTLQTTLSPSSPLWQKQKGELEAQKVKNTIVEIRPIYLIVLH